MVSFKNLPPPLHASRLLILWLEFFGPTAQGYRCCLVLGNATTDQSCRKWAPAGLPLIPTPLDSGMWSIQAGTVAPLRDRQQYLVTLPRGEISTTVCNQRWRFPWGPFMKYTTSLHHRPLSALIQMCYDRRAIWFPYVSKYCTLSLKMHQLWPQDPVFGWTLIIYLQLGFHLQGCSLCALIYTYRWPSYCQQKWQYRLKLILTVFWVYLHL